MTIAVSAGDFVMPPIPRQRTRCDRVGGRTILNVKYVLVRDCPDTGATLYWARPTTLNGRKTKPWVKFADQATKLLGGAHLDKVLDGEKNRAMGVRATRV